jgi:hypothetical protein
MQRHSSLLQIFLHWRTHGIEGVMHNATAILISQHRQYSYGLLVAWVTQYHPEARRGEKGEKPRSAEALRRQAVLHALANLGGDGGTCGYHHLPHLPDRHHVHSHARMMHRDGGA